MGTVELDAGRGGGGGNPMTETHPIQGGLSTSSRFMLWQLELKLQPDGPFIKSRLYLTFPNNYFTNLLGRKPLSNNYCLLSIIFTSVVHH